MATEPNSRFITADGMGMSMGIFDRIRQGFTLLLDSLRLMRNNPRLLLFPIVGGISGLAFLVVFLGITFGAMQFQPEGAILGGLLVAYLTMTFVSTFFTAGLVHQARHAMHGGDVSIRAGLAGAWQVKGRLFLWSLIAATVGALLNGMQNSDSRSSRGLGAIFGIAWTLMTFFIVPVIVFERAGLRGMFKRSAGTFKDTWGETPIGLGGVQVVSGIIAVPSVAVGFLLIESVSTLAGIAVIVAGVAVAFLVGQTLQGVVKTALYVYATEDTAPPEFDNVDFEQLPGDGDATNRGTGGGLTDGRI